LSVRAGLVASLALSWLVAAPDEAAAKALDGEGIVAILPALRVAASPAGPDDARAAPSFALAFGIKARPSLEVGIDVGVSSQVLEQGGERRDLYALPLLLRASWTPTPGWETRPVIHAGLGKSLILVYGRGDEYRELTPDAFMAALGFQADLSPRIGVAADLGYLHARARDPSLGVLDGGGPFVRAGLYFRWEPVRRLGT